MAFSANDLEAKVAEALDEPLLVAIGAVCSTPSQAANKCHELGITTEGEKLAKWVAVLKRDSQILFGADFLGKLKEISDKKFPAEELKMEEKTQNPAEAVKSTEEKITGYDYKKLWEQHFLCPWVTRIERKLSRYKFEGVPVRILSGLKLSLVDENGYRGIQSDYHNVYNNVYLNMRLDVNGQGLGETYYDLLNIEGLILEKSLVKKDSYKNARLDILRIYAKAPVPLKKATTLAKWLKSQKNLAKNIVVIKNF